MNEKVILESLELMQRILTKLISGETVSNNEVQSLSKINNKINQLIKAEGKYSKESTPSLEVEVTRYLEDLGIPKSIKGYQYLRYAIILKFERGNEMASFIHSLYPEVAKKFSTTSVRVERAIRHAITVSWNRADAEKQNELFRFTLSPQKGKATNSEFINAIVDDMKLKRL